MVNVQSTEHRVSLLNKYDRPFHVILSQQFERTHIDELCNLSDMMRSIAETKKGLEFLQSMLRHKRAMIYFTQPSTRTFLSFVSACQILGIPYIDVRDPQVSSEVKGETEEDTVKVLSQYFDLIVMRHPGDGFAEQMASEMQFSIPIINGGSGKDQHPTQALLDIYTLKRSFNNGLENREITFVGDLKRGRTVRSLVYLLCKYKNLHINFVSPPQLGMEADIIDYLKRYNVSFKEHTMFSGEVIKSSDAIYMTRLQDEHDKKGESLAVDYSSYALTIKHQHLFKPSLIIMHPLPRRKELDKALDSTQYAKYWDQVKNGMWMRSAIIAYVFHADSNIINYYHDTYLK